MGKVEVDIRLSIIIFSYYPETKINMINCALYYINHDKLKLIVIFKYIIFFSLDKVVTNIPIKLYSFCLFYNVLSWKSGPHTTSEKTDGEKQQPEIHYFVLLHLQANLSRKILRFILWKKNKQINNNFKKRLILFYFLRSSSVLSGLV